MARLPKHDAESVLEDLAFLDETNVGAIEAAKRAGFASAHAMEKWLERHDRSDLWNSLKRRDPVGAHEQRKHVMNVTTIDPIAAVLDAASRSGSARTRNRAEKVRGMVDGLRATVAQEREDEQRSAEARKQIERLERELADAKAQLKGTTGRASIEVGSGIPAADLRAWARANGIECPPMGRVPATVREAYEEAIAEDESASA